MKGPTARAALDAGVRPEATSPRGHRVAAALGAMPHSSPDSNDTGAAGLGGLGEFRFAGPHGSCSGSPTSVPGIGQHLG